MQLAVASRPATMCVGATSCRAPGCGWAWPAWPSCASCCTEAARWGLCVPGLAMMCIMLHRGCNMGAVRGWLDYHVHRAAPGLQGGPLCIKSRELLWAWS